MSEAQNSLRTVGLKCCRGYRYVLTEFGRPLALQSSSPPVMLSTQHFSECIRPELLTVPYLLRWWCLRALMLALNVLELDSFASTLASSPPSVWDTADRAFLLLHTLAIVVQVVAAVVPLVSITFFESHHMEINRTIVTVGAIVRAMTACCTPLPHLRAYLLGDVLLYLVHQDELDRYMPHVFAMVALHGLVPFTSWLMAAFIKAASPYGPGRGIGASDFYTLTPPAPGAAAGAARSPQEELLGGLGILMAAVAAHKAYRELVGDKEQDVVSQHGHARGPSGADGGAVRPRESPSASLSVRRMITATWALSPRNPGHPRSWVMAFHPHQHHPRHHQHHQHHQQQHRLPSQQQLGTGGDCDGDNDCNGLGALSSTAGGTMDQLPPRSLSRAFAWRLATVAVLHAQALAASVRYAPTVWPPNPALAAQAVSVLSLAAAAVVSLQRLRGGAGTLGALNALCFVGVAFVVLNRLIEILHMDYGDIPTAGIGGDRSFISVKAMVASAPPAPTPTPPLATAKPGGAAGASLFCSLAVVALTLLSVSDSRGAANAQLLVITAMLHVAMLLRAARFRVAGGGRDHDSGPDEAAVGSGVSLVLTTVIATVRSMLSALPASPLLIYLMPLLSYLIFPVVHVPKWVAPAKGPTAANTPNGAATSTPLSRSPTGSQCITHDKPSRQQQQRLSTFNPADVHSARDRLRRGGGVFGPGGGGGSSWLTSRPRFSTSCPGMAAITAGTAAPFAVNGRTRDRCARVRGSLPSVSTGPCPSSALPTADNGSCLKNYGGASGGGGGGVCVHVSGGGSGNGIAVIRRLLVDTLASSGHGGVSDAGGHPPASLLPALNRTTTGIETVSVTVAAAAESCSETGTAQSVVEDEFSRRTVSAPAHGCIELPQPPQLLPLMAPTCIKHSTDTDSVLPLRGAASETAATTPALTALSWVARAGTALVAAEAPIMASPPLSVASLAAAWDASAKTIDASTIGDQPQWPMGSNALAVAPDRLSAHLPADVKPPTRRRGTSSTLDQNALMGKRVQGDDDDNNNGQEANKLRKLVRDTSCYRFQPVPDEGVAGSGAVTDPTVAGLASQSPSHWLDSGARAPCFPSWCSSSGSKGYDGASGSGVSSAVGVRCSGVGARVGVGVRGRDVIGSGEIATGISASGGGTGDGHSDSDGSGGGDVSNTGNVQAPSMQLKLDISDCAAPAAAASIPPSRTPLSPFRTLLSSPKYEGGPVGMHCCLEPYPEDHSKCSPTASIPATDNDKANSAFAAASLGSHTAAEAEAAAAAAAPTVATVIPPMVATASTNNNRTGSRWLRLRALSAHVLGLRNRSVNAPQLSPRTPKPRAFRQASILSFSFAKSWRCARDSTGSWGTWASQADMRSASVNGEAVDSGSGGITGGIHSHTADDGLASIANTGADPWVDVTSPTTSTRWAPATPKQPRTTTTTLQALDASKVFKSHKSQHGSTSAGGGGSCYGGAPATHHSRSPSISISGAGLPGDDVSPKNHPRMHSGCVGTTPILPLLRTASSQHQEAVAAAAATMGATAAAAVVVAGNLGLDGGVFWGRSSTSTTSEQPTERLPSSTPGAVNNCDARSEGPAAAAAAAPLLDHGCGWDTGGMCMLTRGLPTCRSRQVSYTGSGDTFSGSLPAVAIQPSEQTPAARSASASVGSGDAAAAIAVAAEPVVGPAQSEDEQTLGEDQLWIAFEVPVVLTNTLDATLKLFAGGTSGGGALASRVLPAIAVGAYCISCLAHAAALFSPRWAAAAHRHRQLLHSLRQLLCRLLVHGALAAVGHEHRVTPMRAWALVGGLWAILRLRQRLFLQVFPIMALAYYAVHELQHWQTSTPYGRLYDLMRFHLDPLLSYVVTGTAMMGLARILRQLRSTAWGRRVLSSMGSFTEPRQLAQAVLAFAIALQFMPQLIAKQASLLSWMAGQLDRVGLGSLLILVSPTRESQNNDLAVGAVVALFLGVSALQALVLRLPFLQSPRYVWYCKQHVKVLSFMDAVMLSDNSVATILEAFKCATAEAFAGFSVDVALLVADDAEYGDEYGKDGDAADPPLLAAAGASVALHRVHEGTSSLSSHRDQAAAATTHMETCGAGAVAGEDGLLQTSGPLLSRAALGTTPRKRQQVRWLPLNALESLAYATSQRLIVFTNDYSTTSLLFQDWTVLYKSGAGAAMMVVPLVFNGRDLGALEIVSPRPDVFDDQMRRIAVEFSTQLGQVLYNKVVEHEASVGNRLLLEIMPSAVAEQVKRQVLQRGLNDTQQTLSAGASETIVYKHWHPQVSVLFADVMGYTRLSCEVEPEVVMLLLHVLFAKLDALCDQYGCYKVNTIGDCYIACTGLLVEVEDHAQQLVDFGKALLQACSEVDNPMGGKIKMRVGINSGRVMSGIVGKTRPHFTLYGDCVNTASRMESTGLPGTIQITEETYMQLGEQERALWGERRSVQVKGKGAMQTYVFRNEAGAAALAEEEAAASAASPDTSAATIGNWDAYVEPVECDWQI